MSTISVEEAAETKPLERVDLRQSLTMADTSKSSESHTTSAGDFRGAVELSTTSIEAIWRTARDISVDQYECEMEFYGNLAEVIGDLCSILLKGEGVSHQVSNRVKDLTSFRIKVNKAIDTCMAGEIGEQNIPPVKNEDDAISRLDEAIRDRAGVRVLVYFPEDVSRVAQVLQTCKDIKIQGAVVSYTKSRQDHRKEDKKAQETSGPLRGPLNYSDGAWQTYAPVQTGNNVQRWKHSGYRAAHLHISLTPNLDTVFHSTDEEQKSNPTALGQIFRNSTASRVSRSVSQSEAKLLAEEEFKVFFDDSDGTQAEIQITTAVMHAWSQVEHDISYKMPYDMLQSRAVDRMLDGINGLSIITEILLEELERNLKYA